MVNTEGIVKANGKLNMKKLKTFIDQEFDYFKNLLIEHNVPDGVDDFNEDDYLLPSNGKKKNGVIAAAASSGAPLDDLEERMATMKNKMRQKKRPTTERAKAKREAKKLKNSKKFKKVLVSAAKSIKNETNKQIKKEESVNGDADDTKSETKRAKQKPIFNAEGKIVFSKFDFAAQPGMKAKKSHQNPREILKKIKNTDRKISELKEHGDEEKAAEIKNDLAWQKAFDKVEGKKVKDDTQLLYKAIKKRKVEKKKAKTKWIERKERVEMDKNKRQKKRQENLDKRSKDKKNTKLKKASKKGRVIPGF